MVQYPLSSLPSQRSEQLFSTAPADVASRPKKIINNNPKRKKHCPWMSPELLYQLHQQKSLHRRIKKTHHQQQDLILRHRKLRNRTNNLYRQLKNVYFQNQLHAYRRDPKTFWSTINNITGRQKANHQPPTMQLSSLAEHFKSLLHQPGLTNALPFGPDKEDALCTFTPVTSAEVKTLLKNLVTDKAAGPDGIRPKELKTAAAQISDSLSAFFNESLASGQLPEEFKSGLLLPIFKSGKTNSQKAENYRGISLTCILSKVLERIVHSQLCDHFQSSGTQSPGYSYQNARVTSGKFPFQKVSSDRGIFEKKEREIGEKGRKYTPKSLFDVV